MYIWTCKVVFIHICANIIHVCANILCCGGGERGGMPCSLNNTYIAVSNKGN